MNWKKIIAIGLTGCFLFSGCAEQRQNAQKMGEEGTQEDSYESTTFAMDTVMTFHIVAPDGEDLLIDAEQEVKRLEKLFSVTDEDSDIEQINDNAGDKAVTVSADTLALLKAGKQLGKATNNAFDMAIYPIVKAWGFTENEYTIPTQETLDTLLPLRESDGPTLFCFHPASGFAWQFSVLARYLSPRWSITGIQSPRPQGPMASAASLDEVCEHHLRTLLAQQPHGPYYLFGYSLGGTLAQGIAARLRQRGEAVAFLGLLDTWPPETQNWAEKEANGLDPEVLAEIDREREAFLAAQQGQASGELFSAIEGNYADAVRLLTTAHSAKFDGKATLFVAEKTRQEGMDPQVVWGPWVGELEVFSQNCAHVDIISPQAFEAIGPVVREILG